MHTKVLNQFNRARIDQRQVAELIGIARGVIADGTLNDLEIEFLYKWLIANADAAQNPLVNALIARIKDALADGVIDDEERQDLLSTLHELTGADFETGEALKAATLPLDDPMPAIVFPHRNFTFTGTFTFGKRKDVEAVTKQLGGNITPLNMKTHFLVIGEYATDSWLQSSFGTKIVKAVEMREKRRPIALVSEAHWYEAAGRLIDA
ncbi:BRCT domain-containing protein [Polycladidibacter hongkongensis]|uniref:BRCT domain-containing protein n=1 Tax=Polycladidibacter hongkongensis TaxID=1647556 RepID=UPI0008379EEC|nr:BRCT domain-containing protein [Pseudovibrio hongkongensis]